MNRKLSTIAVALSLAITASVYADSDQLIIKYKDGVDRAEKASVMAMANISAKTSLQMTHKRFAFNHSQIVRLSKKHSQERLNAIIKRLESDPDIEYVEIDRILQPAATDNDQYYSSNGTITIQFQALT